jgi:hypothetical protein
MYVHVSQSDYTKYHILTPSEMGDLRKEGANKSRCDPSGTAVFMLEDSRSTTHC